MKRLLLFLFIVMSLNVVAQQEFLTPVSVTVGNEQINTSKGIRAVCCTTYGGPTYNENRNVVRFVQSISPGESVSFDVVTPTNFYGIGLASSTTQTNVYSYPIGNTNLIFGMLVGADNGGSSRRNGETRATGVAIAYEVGYVVGPSMPIVAGNVLRISYVGSTIIYSKSTDGGSTFTPFHSSTITPSGSYFVYFEAPPQLAGPNNIYKTGTVTNQAPTVGAGADVFVTLPLTEATLAGTATDADGTIASRLWEKLGGPSGGSIQSSTSATTLVTALQEGTYVYRFTATDDDGASTSDNVSVFVASADPQGTTIISPSIIPFSADEFRFRGGGSEWWHNQYYVNIPQENNRQELDAYYFRWGWKDLEPTYNNFNWTAFDNEIKLAIDRGQVFSFGFMAQSNSAAWRTGIPIDSASDGTQNWAMFYPLYLHTLMQAEATNSRDWVSVPAKEWVANYNSPNFISNLKRVQDSIYRHIQNGSYNGVQFKNVIDYYDISIVGDYGEWHYSTIATDTTKFPAGRQPTIATYDTILAQAARAMNTFRCTMEVSIFDARQIPNTWIPADVAYFALNLRNAWGPLGWRREQWGFADNQATYVHSWTDKNVKVFGGMRFDTVIMDRHNFAPVTGEPPGNWSNSDVPYMKNLPAEVRLYNAYRIGNGNFYTSPMFRPDLLTQGTRDSVRLASKLAGPRLQIDSATMSTQAIQGGVINLKLYWHNTGACPTYDVWFVKFKIKNQSGVTVLTDTSIFRPKLFRVAANATPYSDLIDIPTSLPAGVYSLWLSIEDSLGYRPPLAIANYGRQADGSHQLRSAFQVVSGTANQSPRVTVTGSTFVQLPTTSDTLTASATDADGTIAAYAWTKVSGPTGGTIVSPTAASTRITGLTVGDYVYEVLVTDNSGGTTTGSIFISVRAANVAPVVYAGADQTLYGATAITFLVGSASDADGLLASTSWSKVSGPTGGTIATPAALSTQVTGLVVGTYKFRLTATDNAGAVTTDDVDVVVVATQPPRVRVILKN